MSHELRPAPLSTPASRRATVVAGVLVAALAGAAMVTGSDGASAAPAGAAPAPTPAACAGGGIWTTTGGADPALVEFSPAGTRLRSLALSREYYDVAFLDDGSTLLGIREDPDDYAKTSLYTIDPRTGVETGARDVTGLPYSYNANALSSTPNGPLLVGGNNSAAIFQIDPVSGQATPFRASFPVGFHSAGDFLSLADGDILAIGSDDSGVSTLFRIAPDGSVTQIGTVPETFGAAQSGATVFLPAADGTLYEIPSVPTAASNAPIPVTSIASTGLDFYGASSSGDGGLCAAATAGSSVSAPAPGGYSAGQTVTLTTTVTNSGGLPLTDVAATQNGITGDGAVGGPSPASIGSLAPGASATTTTTYTLTQSDIDRGGVSGTVVFTGTHSVDTPLASQTTWNIVTAAHPALGLTATLSPDPGAVYAAGQTVTFVFGATNQGNVTLSDVKLSTAASSGGVPFGTVSPASVASLAPGASTTFSVPHVVTPADLTDAGALSLSGTVTGSAPDHRSVTSSSVTTIARLGSPLSAAATSPSGPTTTVGAPVASRLAVTGAPVSAVVPALAGAAVVAGAALLLARRRSSRRRRQRA